jgi:hypothetical protein
LKVTRTVAFMSGATLLASLAVLRAAGAVTPAVILLAGRELRWACPFKLWLGVDCPGCGMTRSVVLALGGRWGEAAAYNPGGPLLVLGMVLLAGALILLPLWPRARDAGWFRTALARLRLAALGYASLTGALVILRWTLGII